MRVAILSFFKVFFYSPWRSYSAKICLLAEIFRPVKEKLQFATVVMTLTRGKASGLPALASCSTTTPPLSPENSGC